MNSKEELLSKIDDVAPFWTHSTGRKRRKVFAIRDYGQGKTAYMVVPDFLAGEVRSVNFYMSNEGFLLEFSPTGDRKLSPNPAGSCLTSMLPIKIRDKIASGAGTRDLVWQVREDGKFFFPFDQFSKPEPVDELLKL